MKTKLLFAFFSLTFFSAAFAQQTSLDYVSNLSEPSAMVHQGTMLYVQGVGNLYQINTTASSPSPVVIYAAPANFYMTNLAISGSTIYISEENYIESTDTSLGSRIISVNLNNLTAPTNVIYTTTQYVSSLAINGTSIYFSSETTPDDDDNFTVQVHKIDISSANPVATVVVSNLAQDEEANDMAFYSNNLLISVGGEGKVFGFDVTDTVITVSDYLSGLNFNKGIYVSGTNLFVTAAHLVRKKQLDAAGPLTSLAQNTTYQDTNGGMPFNANYRDVVLIGDKLYMTLLNQGKVVYVQDASLATDTFMDALKGISIYNSKTDITVKGLETAQQATVYNVSGQQMLAKEISNNANVIDISSLSQGVYFLKLDQKTFKFIK